MDFKTDLYLNFVHWPANSDQSTLIIFYIIQNMSNSFKGTVYMI